MGNLLRAENYLGMYVTNHLRQLSLATSPWIGTMSTSYQLGSTYKQPTGTPYDALRIGLSVHFRVCGLTCEGY